MKVKWIDPDRDPCPGNRDAIYVPDFGGCSATLLNFLESIIADCTLNPVAFELDPCVKMNDLGGLVWLEMLPDVRRDSG